MTAFPEGPSYWRAIEPDARALTVSRGARGCIADPLWMAAQQWRMGEFRHVHGGVPITIETETFTRRLGGVTDAAGTTETLRPTAHAAEILAEPPIPQRDRASLRAPYRLGRSAELWMAEHASDTEREAFAELREDFLVVSGDDPYLRRRAVRGAPATDGTALLRAIEFEDDTVTASPAWPALRRWARTEGVVVRTRRVIERDERPPVVFDPGIVFEPRLFDPNDLRRRRRDDVFDGTIIGGPVFDVFDPSDLFIPIADPSRPLDPEADLYDPVSGRHSGTVSFVHSGTNAAQADVDAGEDGALRWWHFNLTSEMSVQGERQRHRAVPSRISFAGKPAERFWTVTEATADWDAASAGTTDIARTAMGAMICLQSADWFVMPVTVARNAVVQLRSAVFRDGFGNTFDVGVDRDPGRSRLWSGHADLPDGTLVTIGEPPALRGHAIEVADIVPDDMDNLIWMIERTYVDGDGRPTQNTASAPPPTPRKDDTGAQVPTYVLQSNPAPRWYPMVQEDDGFHARPFAASTGAVRSPDSVVLNGIDHIGFGLVPLEGRRTERRWMMGRDGQGSPVRWIARTTARPERTSGSGLAYDILLRPSEG